MIENRQLTGWDEHLYTHGMLVYHIDKTSAYADRWVQNTLNAYTDHYIETTVAHEWAHLATRKVHGYGVASHGPEWKQMMINIGVPPARCHSYKVPEGMNVGKQRQKYRDWETDRKSTRLNSSHRSLSRMPSSA